MSQVKSKKKVIISAIILIIMAGILVFNYLFSQSSFPALGPIEEQESLTNEDYIEDFEYVYDILEGYYPFFEVNKIANNVDWLGNKEEYRDMIAQCNTDDEFYETMGNILSDLNNGHTHLYNIEHGLDSYVLYKMNLPRFDWRVDMVKIFEKPVDKTYSQSTYSFVKDGDFLNKFRRQSGFKKFTNDKIEDFNFPELTSNMVKEFGFYRTDTIDVEPSSDSINYKGNIYLLVDRYVYSSSEKLASFAKDTEMAVLVGERTGGDGIGSDPMLIDLPNTGYVLRFSKELGVTEEGSINELHQTKPDIIVSHPSKFTNSSGIPIISYDEAVITVLEMEGYH